MAQSCECGREPRTFDVGGYKPTTELALVGVHERSFAAHLFNLQWVGSDPPS